MLGANVRVEGRRDDVGETQHRARVPAVAKHEARRPGAVAPRLDEAKPELEILPAELEDAPFGISADDLPRILADQGHRRQIVAEREESDIEALRASEVERSVDVEPLDDAVGERRSRIGLERADEPSESFGIEQIVGVEREDERSARETEAVVSRRPEATLDVERAQS